MEERQWLKILAMAGLLKATGLLPSRRLHPALCTGAFLPCGSRSWACQESRIDTVTLMTVPPTTKDPLEKRSIVDLPSRLSNN